MNEKILLVDDDKLVLKSVGKALEKMGYFVLPAQSGQEACKIASENEPDLIISDIRMPQMSGFETLKKIKQNSKNKIIPAIIITGYNSEEGIHDDGKLGITAYLNKPFEIDELAKAIKKNLKFIPHYERQYPRISVNLPVKIIGDKDNLSISTIEAKTVTLSKGGVSCEVEEELSVENNQRVNIEIFFSEKPFTSKVRIAWKEKKIRNKKVFYGFQFVDTEQKDLSYLEEIIDDYRSLSEEFVLMTEQIENYVKSVKSDLDRFDSTCPTEKKQIEFLLQNKESIFGKLTAYFDNIWDIAKNFDQERYIIHKNYYQQKLGSLLLDPIETNKRIHQKPLGYPGDYIMMNCIFEYNEQDKFLGDTTYQKLINHYTCNIPISSSNVARKNFLKKTIKEIIKNNENPKIVSLGCGSARELTELVEEEGVEKPTNFVCLDLEEKALQYIKEEISKISKNKKRFLSIEYLHKDIIQIIRDKNLRKKFEESNLIYLSGIYDYLSNKIAERLVKYLYPLIAKEGKLVICNVSLENSRHKAYYELLGEWHMIHRTGNQMLKWTQNLENAKVLFSHPSKGENYHFLIIQKEK